MGSQLQLSRRRQCHDAAPHSRADGDFVAAHGALSWDMANAMRLVPRIGKRTRALHVLGPRLWLHPPLQGTPPLQTLDAAACSPVLAALMAHARV